MLKVDRNSWHARMYLWHRRQKGQHFTNSVNLCPYMRTVLLWAPLRWLLLTGRKSWLETEYHNEEVTKRTHKVVLNVPHISILKRCTRCGREKFENVMGAFE